MHQPIVNNFISISQDEPVKIKTSLKDDKNRIGKESMPKNSIEKRHFNYRYIIGKGGFGKVWKVEHSKTRNQHLVLGRQKKLRVKLRQVNATGSERMF